MADDPFVSAATAIADTVLGDEPSLARHLLLFLPVDGAAISTLGDTLGSETISATDSLAARLDEVQFDLGEGPCWEAMSSQRPVLEPHFAEGCETRWPAFADEIKQHAIGAIFAFPLTLGSLQIGAIDIYTEASSTLSSLQVSQTSLAATLISRVVLRHALRANTDHEAAAATEYSRRIIHQATGITLAQLRIPPEDALLLIQGHAFATERRMIDVAGEIVEGRLQFRTGTDGIEDQR